VVATTAPVTTGVVRMQDEHAALVADFYRKVWDRQATFDRVLTARRKAARENVHGVGIDVPTYIFLNEGMVAGHVTTIPIRIARGGRVIDAHWLKGLMVLPEYRNGPVGYHVLRRAVEDLGTTLAAVVAADARRLFTALGFKDLGAIPNRVRILNYSNVLNKLSGSDLLQSLPRIAREAVRLSTKLRLNDVAGGAAGGVTQLLTGLVGGSALRAQMASGCPTDQDIDQLWQRVSRNIGTVVQRDAKYLRPRYEGSDYRWIVVHEQKQLRGLAVLKTPRAQGDPRLLGVRAATVAEVVVAPHDASACLALLRGAERVSRAARADVMICSASHPALLNNLQRRAYLPFGGNVGVLVRNGETAGLPNELNDWWLTRGDSAADEVF
jgi:GNAT superfamily N-acetyltransferase